MAEITTAAGLGSKQHASTYLSRLQDLFLVRREIPTTVRNGRRTTQGRYILSDAYHRFYFRFIAPYEMLLEQRLIPRLWEIIHSQMRAFVGMTAFEELCREWVRRQAIQGSLPFLPDRIGSHWAKDAQVDVVAIRWDQRQILLGEAKWSTDRVGRKILTDLIAKATKVVPDKGEGWTVHYALFARSGFTEAAVTEAQKVGALLVDLEAMGRDLDAR